VLSGDNTAIRIIGISLNDLLRHVPGPLRNLWEELERRVRADSGPKLDIKMLIIDPQCFGAHLRARGEVRHRPQVAAALFRDVDSVLWLLAQLEGQSRKNNNVKFECRLYRLAPILFLCQTDKLSYMQQYLFWSKRPEKSSVPVIKVTKEPEGKFSLHGELTMHFDWVWEHASYAVPRCLNEHLVGCDKALGVCAATNVYLDDEQVRQRISWLLTNAKEEVSIQGFSLHAFFHLGSHWIVPISDLIRDRKVRIRVLLLEAECEQAFYRTYREQAYPGLSFEEYRKEPARHKASALYRDTMLSISKIREIVRDCRAKDPKWQPNIELKLYRSAPTCFMLRVDDTVLVEQYHYGKVEDPKHTPGTSLGKDMPLFEFAREPAEIYKLDPDDPNPWWLDPIRNRERLGLRYPFALLENHFDFAFDEAGIEPVIDE
jgi:hypothetical protein